MTDTLHSPKSRSTTQAAEGLPRMAWTIEEFERLIELGILGKDDRIELIGGELVPMSPKGIRHERVRTRLLNWIARRLPEGISFGSELGWRPGGNNYAEPDLCFFPSSFDEPTVPPKEILLLIEVAKSSLEKERGVKAELYAGLGVREYWVVDAVTLRTHIHRLPKNGKYTSISAVPKAKTATPELVPDIAVCFKVLMGEAP